MRSLVLGVGATALALLAPAAQARTLGSLEFTPCTLSLSAGVGSVEAQCGKLTVPENRAEPNGRKIDLAIAWVPSKAAEPAPDPVFMLAGGPGQSALESYPQIAPAFREVVKKRHVILVDQRGTGKSHPLVCKNSPDGSSIPEGDESLEFAAKYAADCAAGLDADPKYYSTTDGIEDLDAVRAAIGAEQINLMGVSYGTRVAQTYLRRYPEHVRTVLLDGVVPQSLILGSEHSRNLENALDLNFERCQKDKLCKERFGSPRAHLDELYRDLKAHPRMVKFRDPTTGEEREEKYNVAAVAAVVRLYAYVPVAAGMLPLILNEAANGHPEPLMAQSKMLRSMLGESINSGMQLSVMCSEDVGELKVNPDDENTTLGNAIAATLIAQCKTWPHRDTPAGFHEPVASDKPVLLISGEFDPVTPPRYGDEVAKHLTTARHLVVKGAGHNVIGAGCMPKLFGEFVKTADPKALNAKCLDDITYAAPFAGFYGWEP